MQRENESKMRASCDACGYETEVEEYGPHYGDVFNRLGRRPRFCGVCSATFISQTQTNPENLTIGLFFRSIGWIANAILDRIGRAKDEIISEMRRR